MKSTTVLITTSVAIMLLLSTGCTRSSTTSPTDSVSDQQQITELTTNEDADYFTLDDVADDGTFGVTGGATDELDSTITPLRWGRILQSSSVTHTVTVDSNATDTARVSVVRTVHGVMRIVTATDTIDKPFTDVYRRSAVYHRIARTRVRRANWVMVRISAVEGQTQADNSVELTSVKWYKKASTDANWIQVGQTVTNPATYWQTTATLPQFSNADSVKVEVAVHGVIPFYGQLRYHPRRAAETYRRSFTATNDTSYTVLVKIPSVTARSTRSMFIDFMTRGSVYDNTLVYAANVWGLLYKVN